MTDRSAIASILLDYYGAAGPDAFEVADDIALAMQSQAPNGEAVERASQILQDHMEQEHGIALNASQWDAAATKVIAALKAPATPNSERGGCKLCGYDREAHSADGDCPDPSIMEALKAPATPKVEL